MPFLEKARRFTLSDTFLLTQLYCLNGIIDKAEALAQATGGWLRKDALTDSLETELVLKLPT